MTREEAIANARRVAETEGWTWLAPIEATLAKRRGERGRCWVVTSNAGNRGCNVRIAIDDATGETLTRAFGPR